MNDNSFMAKHHGPKTLNDRYTPLNLSIAVHPGANLKVEPVEPGLPRGAVGFPARVWAKARTIYHSLFTNTKQKVVFDSA
jgi:hypothetical protein